jgi:multiple sugar transport system permease protein
VIIYLAALTGVRSELYEAAEVDGAALLRKIWHITLPQLRSVLFVTLILQLIGTFQVFTEPFLLTQGGPADSTVTVLLLIFRYAFGAGGGGDYGAAAALSLMLAAFLALFTAVYFRATRAWSDG